ncbi:MAG: hypothetical protein WD847_14575 [Pirellulales bacterium]
MSDELRTNGRIRQRGLAAALLALLLVGPGAAREDKADYPLVFEDDFEQGAQRWQPSDERAWKVVESEAGKVYSQFKQSDYQPPVRSPLNFSLVRDLHLGDLVLEARLRSTVKDYGHRDMCLFFGFQDPSHFYYVHLGKQTDDHANQVFIVNGAPRRKISIKTSSGTDWDDEWHRVKLVRRVDDGTIAVYFDDMETPVMTARDKTFTWGRVGLGSFDDTGDWDDVKLYGVETQKP